MNKNNTVGVAGIPSSLRDIAIQGKDSSVFFEYKNREEIGKLIFAELYKRFSFKEGKQGFYMSDDSKEIGLLSQCQSLQSMMLLASDFGLDFNSEDLLPGKKKNRTIREVMDLVIEDVLDKIKSDIPGEYRFDASPWETELFTVEYSNIDAITWVIPTFLLVLQYHATQAKERCRFEKELISVVKYGLNYIDQAFIDPQEYDDTKLQCGWNFTKDCQEPSLYYTFAVCECYVDVFKTFEELLKYQEALRNYANYPEIGMNTTLQTAHEEHLKDKLERDVELRDFDRTVAIQKGDAALYDPYNELVRLFTEINGGNSGIEKTLYGQLESKCKQVGNRVWELTQSRLADNYFYNDLSSVITEADLQMSTTSDALFNSVYIINILLDVGLDEDLLVRRDSARAKGNEAEALSLQREYDDLFEVCQLACQRAFRGYENLKKEGKEYIVDQFLVGFNERFTTHQTLIRELRKRRMRVFSLTPLLIHTNNVISEYLVKYPQINMRKYLGYIMDNRLVERNQRDGSVETKWLWENDGYFSASNYYFIAALSEFYAYYHEFEEKFFTIEETNSVTVKKIQDEYKQKLTETGEIADLKKQLDEKDKIIAQQERKIEEKTTPVEDAVKEVLRRELPALLPDTISAYLLAVTEEMRQVAMNDEKKLSENHISVILKSLLLSMLDEKIWESVNEGLTMEERVKKFEALKNYIKLDFKKISYAYIDEINDNKDSHRSRWYNTTDK